MAERLNSLLADLDAFYLEHRRCGDLRLESEPSERCVMVWCPCGALIVRRVDNASDRPASGDEAASEAGT